MAIKTTKSGVIIDDSYDYSAAIDNMKAKGDLKTAEALERKRAAKVQDASAEQIKQWGVSDDDLVKYGVKKPTAAVKTQAVPVFDPMAEYKKLSEMQIKNTIAALDKQRKNSLSNLQAERATIKPMYYDKGNQIRTNSANQSRSFSEYLASRGLNSGGVAADVGSRQNMALAGQLGQNGRQEQAAYDEIERRTTGINNAYESDRAMAKAGGEATLLQNTIAEMQRQDTIKRQEEQFNKQFGLQESGVTGIYNGQQTIQGRNAAMELQTRQLQNEIEKYKLDMMKDPNSPENRLNMLKLKEAEALAPYAPQEAALRLEQIRASINQTNAATSNIGANNDLDRAYKQAQIDALKNKPTEKAPTASKVAQDKVSAILQDIGSLPVQEAYDELYYNYQDYIDEIGITEYNKLLNLIKSKMG